MFQVAELFAAQFVVQRLLRKDRPATRQAGQGGILVPTPGRPGHVRKRFVPAAPQTVQIAGR